MNSSERNQEMEEIRKFGERWMWQMQGGSGSPSPVSNQPKVPERAAVAASLARRITSLPPHERIALPSNQIGEKNNNSFYGGMSAFVATRVPGQEVEEIDERSYEESFDPVRAMLESLPPNANLQYFGVESGKKLLQLDDVTARLSRQVMEHHEDMVAGMQLVTELERDLQLVLIICKNARRNLAAASREVSQDLVVTSSVCKKQVLTDMLPVLLRMQDIVETKGRLEATVEEGNYAKALRMCSECLMMIEECSQLRAIQDMNKSIEEWLTRTIERVDGLLLETCRHFNSETYASVIDAYAVMDYAASLSEKVQTYFAQAVVSETYEVLRTYYFMASEGRDPQLVLKKSRLPYNELCTHLSDSVFRECLRKTLAVLFDLLCSYHTMMCWQHPKVATLPPKTSGPSHKRLGSAAFLPSPDSPNLISSGKTTVLSSSTTSPFMSPRKPPSTSGPAVSEGSKGIPFRPNHLSSPSQSNASTPFGTPTKVVMNNSENEVPGGDFREVSTNSTPQRAVLGEVQLGRVAEPIGPSSTRREADAFGTASIERAAGESALPADGDAVSVSVSDSVEEGVGREEDMVGKPTEGEESFMEGPMAADTLANRMRVETTAAVRKSLERGRKTAWELAARRVSALLSADAMVSATAHQFLQALEWTNRFILAGEAFSGADALGLRAKVTRQSEKYFKTFHRQSLEVLRMMQERENWQPLPPSALQNVNLAGLTGDGAAVLATSPLGLNNDAGSASMRSPLMGSAVIGGADSMGGERLGNGDVKTSFADWMAAGNPFKDDREGTNGRGEAESVRERERDKGGGLDRDERDAAGGADVGPEGDGEEEARSGGRAVKRANSEKLLENAGNSKALVANGVSRRSVSSLRPSDWSAPRDSSIRRIASERSWKGGLGGGVVEEEDEEEEEDEREELMADFIDEESQKPSGRSSAQRYSKWPSAGGSGPTAGGGGGDGKVVITGSSVSVLRFMDRYARLMQILQPISAEVFKGLCQLFDLYLLAIFRTFGQREAFTLTRIQNETPTTALLTPRLRATLVRISQGLDEYRARSGPPPSGDNVTPLNAHPAAIVSPGNLYGLRERCVATESILWLAEFMRRCRPRFQALLPQSALPAMEHFYARTVDAVPDLREHVHKALARLLMNVGGYADRIANVRWETREVGLDHNQYVDQLVGEYRMFAHRVAHAGVAKQVQEQLLQYGSDAIAEALVEGYSRVKRCTNEGRALMSLDLQVLMNGLQAVSKLTPNMELVEHYIKAFYLPETEYLHWARTHSEYTRAQIVALINLVSATNNWKRKTRTDILEKIDSGDL